jgi:enamine deaminase RidA (YjgF/YER057c/UK114 family)
MTLKRIDAGKRMSSAVVHGGKVYLAGFVAEAAAGKSVNEQTKDILGQIDVVLKKAGTSKTNIIKANIWLTDIKTFNDMNAAWDAWVVPGQTPARATVESKLAAPGFDVEIMVEAAILKPANRRPAPAAKRAAKAAAKRGAKKPATKTARKAAKKARKK